MTTHKFQGRVIDRSTKLGLTNLRVEALDVRQVVRDVVCAASTGVDGAFTLDVEDDDLDRLFGKSRPVLAFRVVDAAHSVLFSTERSLRWYARGDGTGDIEVDPARVIGKLPGLPKYTLEVTVYDPATGPVSRNIKLLEVDLTASDTIEHPVGGITPMDSKGFARIEYEPTFAGTYKPRPRLKVRCEDGAGVLIAETHVCRARPRERVTLVVGGGVYPGPTRHDTTLERVTAALGPASLASMTTAQRETVACRANLPFDEVDAIASAAAMNAAARTISTEAFYGIIKSGLPRNLADLAQHRLPSIRTALEESIARNDVSPSLTSSLSTTMSSLESRLRSELFLARTDAVNVGFIAAQYPALSGAQNEFVRLAMNHDGDAKTFWDAIEANGTTAPQASRFRFIYEAAPLVASHPAMLAELARRRESGALENERALAQYTKTDWLGIIATVGRPTTAASNDAYADSIVARVEARFRTRTIAWRVKQASAGDILNDFFFDGTREHNVAFDFATIRVDRYLAENRTALNNVAVGDREQAKTRLRQMERLFRVTESYAQMKALIDVGIESATTIHEMGLARFIGKVSSPTIDSAAAKKIFELACWTTATANMLKIKFSGMADRVGLKTLPKSFPNLGSLPPKIADWATLFGSLDACACEHCQSVYGPAAYLVDLLRFLAKQNVTTGPTTNGEALFFSYRPDVLRLSLSCENADTPIPYIDLVNEVLEVKTSDLLPSPPAFGTAAIQVDRTEDEQLGAPQTPYPAEFARAYRYFAGETFSTETISYPPASVFHLWNAEARLLLQHLDAPRYELLRLLAISAPTADDTIAAERLGISRRAYRLIAGLDGTNQELWGSASATWDDDLGALPTFLRRSRLSFEEARQLESSHKADGDTTPLFTIRPDVLDPCDTSKMTVSGLTPIGLGLISRLLRLRSALGWTIHEAAQVIATMADNAITDTFLRRLARLEDVRTRLGLSPLQASALYANLSRNKGLGLRSFFGDVFLSKIVADPDTTAFSAVESNAPTGDTLIQHRATLLAASGWTEAEFDLAVPADLPIAGGNARLVDYPISDHALGISNLSRLYRLAVFSQAAGLPLGDYLVLRAYSNLDVLEGDGNSAEPDNAIGFLSVVDTMKNLGVDLAELDFYLRDFASNASGLRPPPAEVEFWESEVRSGVLQVASRTSEIQDDEAGAASNRLLLALPLSPAERGSVVSFVEQGGDPSRLDPIGPFVYSLVDLKTRLNPAGGLPSKSARFSLLAQQLARYVDAFNFVVQWLASRFPCDAAIVRQIVGTPVIRFGGQAAIRAFLPDLDPPGSEPLEGTVQDRKDILQRIQKAIGIIRQLRLTPTECAHVFPPVADLPGLDLNDLPIPATPPPAATNLGAPEQARFATWLRLARLVELRNTWPAGSESLFAVFAAAASGASLGALQQQVANGLDAPLTDVTELCTRFGLDAASFRDELGLLKLSAALAVTKRLGVSAKEAIRWTNVDEAIPASLPQTDAPGATDPVSLVRAIRRVARARNGSAAWRDVVRPLRDKLREKQRDALVELLLHKKNKNEARDLFADIFLDVEMTPAQLTSRIVQATGAIQTFVQRSLLRYYNDFQIDEAGANQWRWMKNYRVWEANRKIFLYPENWIQPELRDDKTPLFEAFERQLRQGPITLDRAESAYRTYLEGLEELSSLDVRAVCWEPKNGQTLSLHASENRTYHVFARTRSPHRYYHRRFEDGAWHPWEKLDIDIEGDHLMAIFYQGSLYLIWPILTDAPHPNRPADGEDPYLNTKVSFRSAERRHDRWSAGQDIGAFELWTTPPRGALSFQVFPYQDRLAIHVLSARWDPPISTQAEFYQSHMLYLATLLWNPLRPHDTNMDGAGVQTLSENPAPAVLGDSTPKVEVARADLLRVEDQFFVHSAEYADNRLVLYVGNDDGVVGPQTILNLAPPPFRLVVPRTQEPTKERKIVILQDSARTFVARLLEVPKFQQTPTQVGLSNGQLVAKTSMAVASVHKTYRFERFDHPFIYEFRKALATGGLDGLLRRQTQSTPRLQDRTEDLAFYGATSLVEPAADGGAPLKGEVDFKHGSPMGVYNWELFFHLPFAIAVSLSRDGRYEDALKWFHYIFDPMNGSALGAPQSFWGFKPFYTLKDLVDIQAEVAGSSQNEYVQEVGAWTDASLSSAVSDTFHAQIATWRKNPFNPHAIARLRPVAYMKAVVLKYIDNLLGWADQLFSRDTIESINEATQLYLLAWDILGPRPNLVPTPPPPSKTYGQLKAIDEFGNAFIVNTEAIAKYNPALSFDCDNVHPPPLIGSPYFCTPPNAELLGKWDVVEDRLFKIRHSQNIEGITRQLPLFAPPIDPALLVQAAAFGIDIQSVLNDIAAGAPAFRFTVLHARATEITSFVISLGSQLLSAIEKKDAEHLAMVRAEQDVEVQALIRETKKLQIKAAKEDLAAAERSRRLAEERRDFYKQAQGNTALETSALLYSGIGQVYQTTAQTIQGSASSSHYVPNFHVGVSGVASPVEITVSGGESAGNALGAVAAGLGAIGSAYQWGATTMATQAGYERRDQEFKLQESLAKKEIAQIDKQIAATRIRVAVAESELTLTEKQLTQARDVRRVMLEKFSKEDLYDWMAAEASAVYYQAYKLAYDVAKKAERAYQIERGDSTQTYVRFGYWDSLKQGLLAGEKLGLDLRRLDAAYLESRRELELTKNISLAKHDPEQLLALRETGVAKLRITENDYDRDYPTHYLRRLKQVSVSMPCVTGPYEGVSATLSLGAGDTRVSPTAGQTQLFHNVQSICTSTAREDSGTFELNFRDERLLPFEGVGAHVEEPSDQWRFELSNGNELIGDSISDLVLHIRYTARSGRNGAATATNRKRLFRLKHDFADGWAAYQEGTANEIVMSWTSGMFSAGWKEKANEVKGVAIFTRAPLATGAGINANLERDTSSWSAGGSPWSPGGSSTTLSIWSPAPLPTTPVEGTWKLSFTGTSNRPSDVWIIVTYNTTAL